MNRIKDITGKKFGKLTAIEFAIRRDNMTFWHCKCDCGGLTTVASSNLQSGNVRSCGCLINAHKRNAFGESLFLKVYRYYTTNAQRRNLEFIIDRNSFKRLLEQNCYYCGTHPNRKINPPSSWSKAWKELNIYYVTGVDRVDPDKGYTLDNCVSCCKTCNKIKSTLTEKEFLNHITTIYNHKNKLKEGSDEIKADEKC